MITPKTAAGRMTMLGILMALPLTATEALANCANNWPLSWEMPITSSHYGKSLLDVVSQSGFYRAGSTRNYDNRLSFKETPGGTPGIRMNVPKGENEIVSFDTAPLGAPGAEKACLSVDVYFSSGFDWGTAGTKLGIGLWGGDTDSNNSGGIPAQLQEGWSVRVVQSKFGARAYSYHLNRNGSVSSGSHCLPYSCEYGQTLGNHVPMKIGTWNNVQIEVGMNVIGSSNGTLRMWVNGTQVVSSSNLQWRTKSSWAIQGLKFTDMWGGDTSDSVNFSPRAQEIFYRNYRLYSSGGSTSSSSSTSSSTSSSSGTSASGSFGPLFPTAGIDAQPLTKISWKSHAQATRYYVRLVDRTSFVEKFGRTYEASAINCFGGEKLCEIDYVGASLSNGEHRYTLRALNGSKVLEEYVGDFDITSSGNTSFTSESASTSSSTTSSSTGTTVSGSFAPVLPTSGTTIKSLPTMSWNSHSNADGYYVRIVERTNFKELLSTRFMAADMNCSGGNKLCQVSYPGVTLRDGPHRFTLRALKGSTRLQEYVYDFVVDGSAPAATTSATSSSSSSSSSGSLVAQSPTGTVTDHTPLLKWSGGGYDSYYLKIVNSSGKVSYGSSISPSAASCSGDSNCQFNVPSNLPADSYLWRIRGVIDGKQTEYSSLDVVIK